MATTTTTTTGFAFQAIAFFFLGFISPGLADEVVDLTSNNFKKHVGQDRHSLVEFYTSWSGHCKKLAPEYERLADHFSKEKSVLIGKVNCETHSSLCKKYDVTGYPTIKWFPKGSSKPKEFKGNPTAQGLAEFVNSRAGTKVKIHTPPSSVVVLSADDFDKIVMDETKHVLVEFYAPWCGHCKTLAPIYEKVATAFRLEKDVVIANVDADKHKGVAEKFHVAGFPTLKFFPKRNKAGQDYSGARDLDGFVTFINNKCGTYRDANGKLSDKAGIIESLDELVKKFVSAGDEEKRVVFTWMKEEVEKFKDPHARHGKIYLKAAESSLDKGPDYAKKEVERIDRISSKTISDAKADEFAVKKNILLKFA